MPEKSDFVMPPEWGAKLEPNVKWANVKWVNGYGPSLTCEMCDGDLTSWIKLIVGFSPIVTLHPAYRGSPDCNVGRVVIQCPCAERYWLYVSADTIDFIRKSVEHKRNNCPALWPTDESGQPL